MGAAIGLLRSPRTARRWRESWRRCPHVGAVAPIETLSVQPDPDRPAERSRLAAGFTVQEGVVAPHKAAPSRDAKSAWESGPVSKCSAPVFQEGRFLG